jgi:hypothetical protein
LNNNTTNNNGILFRLTALWALNESGLGGLLFALHIPLTGFLVGGFAVVLISLIAYYSHYSARQIIQSTLLVLLVKMLVSPHSPPPAYLAVAFQGFCGALLFGTIRNYKIATFLLAILGLAESALQKVLLLTLVFGTSIWNALNEFFKHIVHSFHLPNDWPFSSYLIIIYVLLHIIWGIIIALFCLRLPDRLASEKEIYFSEYLPVLESYNKEEQAKSGTKKRKWLQFLFLLVLSAILLCYHIQKNESIWNIALLLLRSLAVLFIIFKAIPILVRYLLQKWLAGKPGERKQKAEAIIKHIPLQKSYIAPAYQIARMKYKGLKLLGGFVYTLLLFALYTESE